MIGMKPSMLLDNVDELSQFEPQSSLQKKHQAHAKFQAVLAKHTVDCGRDDFCKKKFDHVIDEKEVLLRSTEKVKRDSAFEKLAPAAQKEIKPKLETQQLLIAGEIFDCDLFGWVKHDGRSSSEIFKGTLLAGTKLEIQQRDGRRRIAHFQTFQNIDVFDHNRAFANPKNDVVAWRLAAQWMHATLDLCE